MPVLWGVFDRRDEDNDIHVVQACSHSGHALPPHKFSYLCECHPRFEKDGEGDLIIIHNDLTGYEDKEGIYDGD